MSEQTDGIRFKDYLGDGVYAGFDGYQIWLWTLEGSRIAIEPAVYEALTEYTRRLLDRVKAELEEQP